jgi:hypothetical protein
MAKIAENCDHNIDPCANMLIPVLRFLWIARSIKKEVSFASECGHSFQFLHGNPKAINSFRHVFKKIKTWKSAETRVRFMEHKTKSK